MKNSYIVKRVPAAPSWNLDWDDPSWATANTATLEYVDPKSNGDLPTTQFRLVHDGKNIYGIFRVDDVSIIATHTEYNSSVCTDSCVEFFCRTSPEKGHFNYEMSYTGAHLNYYVRDCRRTEHGFADYTEMPWEDAEKMPLKVSNPSVVNPARIGKETWYAMFQMPVDVMEKYCGPIGDLSGQTWEANLYKCGEALPNRHWIEWQEVHPLNFHQPDQFGTITFE